MSRKKILIELEITTENGSSYIESCLKGAIYKGLLDNNIAQPKDMHEIEIKQWYK